MVWYNCSIENDTAVMVAHPAVRQLNGVAIMINDTGLKSTFQDDPEFERAFKLFNICTIQSDDMYALESELHHRFRKTRQNGEWFKLTPDDVDYIKSLANGEHK